jgi:hydroxymethylpyrimidine kinase/phosphomethylpyrimidine kinase
MNAFGIHGCSVITALTAQNSLGVQALEPVSASMIRAQLQSLDSDLPPAVIKTGMLGSSEICKILTEFLATKCATQSTLLVCDPVLQSTSGSTLLDPEALDLLIHGIFPHVSVLTPNLPEAEKIIGKSILHIEAAADQLLDLGVESVLIKGGHAKGDTCRDYWTDGQQALWLSSPRLDTLATHGTGCILSSAIASALALGQETPEAIITAKTFLNQCLKTPAQVGASHGPMRIEPFRDAVPDRPTLVVGGVGDPAPQNKSTPGNPGSSTPATNPGSSTPATNPGSATPATDPGSSTSATDPGSATPATDPGSATPATSLGSSTPATTKHSHLRRLSKIFTEDPIYFVTTNTKGRNNILDNPRVHKILREEWDAALDRHGWAIGSYVIMPDHVHFFCKPTHEAIKLSALMQHWKQWTSKRIKKDLKMDEAVWQSEFFDHVLRSHESYSEKWNYVEQNPVRAGLVDRAEDWSYLGFIHYK